jgi:hypothetical protein
MFRQVPANGYFQCVRNGSIINTSIIAVARNKSKLDVLQNVQMISGHPFQELGRIRLFFQ